MFAFASVSAGVDPARLGGSPARRRTCGRRRVMRMCADSPGSAAVVNPANGGSGSNGDGVNGDRERAERDLERAEEAKSARIEAERLELLAAQAALGAERAQLLADRKRLELEKAKLLSEKGKRKGGDDGEAGVEKRSAEDTSTGDSDSAGSVAVESGGPAENASNSKSLDKTPPAGPVSSPSKLPRMSDAELSSKLGKVSKDLGPMMGPSLSELLGIDFPRISEDDIEIIKEKVLSMKVFYVTDVDRSPFDERILFRGNLRTDASAALDILEEGLVREGLTERVRLFILMDPKSDEQDGEEEERPVVVALPAAALPNQTTGPSAVLTVTAALFSIFTSLSYGIGLFGLNPAFLQALTSDTLETQQVLYTLPISMGALGIAFAHEISHRVAAAVHGVKLGLPILLPSIQVGTFGTITPLQSYPRRRSHLFDVAAAGPLVGAGISLGMLVAGMLLTAGGNVADWFPQIPSALFNGSLLFGSLGKLILPEAMREQATLAVHPLLVVGYTGMLVNALNLLPVGRLDGGRIIQALYGRAVAARVSGLTFILQGLATIYGESSLLFMWCLLCVFLQREADYPCLDEVSEPSDARFAVGLGALVFMLAVLIPFPQAGSM